MLCMLGCDIVDASNNVVASDYHGGFTGGKDKDNVYTLSNVPAGDYTIRYFVCNSSDSPQHELSKSNGNIIHVGNVAERGVVSETVTINASESATFWKAATLYPAGLPVVASAKCKRETVVTVPAGAGDVSVSFVYSGGNHGLRVLGVDLVGSNGNVVAHDYRNLQAGGNKQPQKYTMSGVAAGTYLMRWYIVNDATNNDPSKFSGSATVTWAPVADAAATETFFNSIKAVAAAMHTANGTNAGKSGYYTTESHNALAAAKDLTEATAANAGTIAEAIEHAEIALPQAGKFYRIAYDFGSTKGVNYLQGKNVSVSSKGECASYSAEDGAASIFYYSNDGKLLSYTAGRYLAVNSSSRGIVGVGVAGANATFAASPRTLGKLTLNMGSYVHANTSGSILFVDRCSNDVCANHDHIVTEVTTIPVTISAAGYSTLYSPVALTLPDNENVKAYYVTTTTSAKATLDEITDRVIPANAGVILSGPEGTYDLTVGGEATADENNKLTGTVASAYIAEDAYVLSNKNGIGLYLAAKNQENDTKWLNNGFKAYMLKTQVPSGAPALTFDFGTETGIEGIEGIEGAVKANGAIYDLSGRRVKNATKGIFIINGKKVIK